MSTVTVMLNPAVTGRFNDEYWSATNAVSGARMYASFALPLDDSSTLISAVLRRPTGATEVWLYSFSGPVTTTPSDGNPYANASSLGALLGSPSPGSPVDITSYVQSMVDDPEWNQHTRHVGIISEPLATNWSGTLELELTVLPPPNTGDGSLGYLLGNAATGSRPAVPPKQGHGALGYMLGWAAYAHRPPIGNQGGGTLTYALGRAATGRHSPSGVAVAGLRLGPTATGRRDAKGSSGLSYQLGTQAASTAPPPTPPPPWRDAIASPEYLAAITARVITSDARVDILDPSGAVIAQLGGPHATHGGVVSGNVTVADGRDVWWDCDLTIDQAALMPTQVGDLLHPLSHNRLRVWWRVLVGPGRWIEVPVGVYCPDWPSVSVSSSDATVSVTVRGQDVAWLISQAQMQGSSSVGGLTIDAAIRMVLSDAAPWAPLTLATTGRRLPAGFEAGEPGADPWQVCRDMASSAGLELRVTREGTIELGAAPSPSAPAVANFVEGVDCLAISASTSVPVGSVANRVRVECTPRRDPDGQEEIEPFTVTVTDDDPTSPLWIGHGYRYDKSVRTDTCTTVEQARAMGEGLLRASQALSETGEIVIFPHPHLDVGDVIDTSIPSVGMVGARQIRGWSLALGSLGGQRVTTTGRRQW